MNRTAAPRFAMSFTPDTVILERHDHSGWQVLGQARFDRGDLAARLAALRDAEAGSSDAPDTDDNADPVPDTVVVIPEDQILYTTLTIPPGAEHRHAVARALDGLTPYKVDELAFDWTGPDEGQGDSVRVAAVARRTLQEAEEFAISQGFLPVRFIARPERGRFPGQPDFGESALMVAANGPANDTAPDLAQAGVTAPGIALPAGEVEPAEPAAAGPVVSRITPHHVAGAVTTVAASDPVTDRLRAAVTAARTAQVEAAAASTAAAVEVAEDVDPADITETAVATTTPEPADPADTPAARVIRHGANAVGVAAVATPAPAAGASTGTAKTRPIGAATTAPPAKPANMSARAQAVHARAAEARERRAQASGKAAAPTGLQALIAPLVGKMRTMMPAIPAGARGKLPQMGTLPSLLIGLAVILIGALLIFGTRPQVDPQTETPAQVAATDEPASVVTTAAPADSTAPVETASTGNTAPADNEATEDTTEATALPDGATAPQDMAETAPPAEAAAPVLTDEAAELATTAVASAAQSAQEPAPQVQPIHRDMQDPLTAALAEAMGTKAVEDTTEPGEAGAAAEATPEQAAPTTVAAAQPATAQQTTRTAAQPATSRRLDRSARPQAAPRAAEPSVADSAPAVPRNPQPFEQRSTPEPAQVTNARPRSRPTIVRAAATETAAPVAATAQQPAPAPATAPAEAAAEPVAPTRAQNASRPPRRPATLDQGSSAGTDRGAALSPTETLFLHELADDLRSAGLTAGAFDRLAAPVADGPPVRFAQARPQPRPGRQAAPSDSTATDAVASAPAPAAKPAASRGGLSDSFRPQRRPGTRQVAAAASPASSDAIDGAVAAAVSEAPVTLSNAGVMTLRASSLPKRRPGGNNGVPAAADTAIAAAMAAPQPAPEANSGADDAARAAAAEQQRREDAELQAQAEARARARASADAAAEAKARAAAEARARAQAEAEARAAASRRQEYRPPEAENEPDVAAVKGGGATPGNVASSATIKDGITLNRTQIIGTIGAGKGSRALVRLSNGKIITLRLGDRINGGQITAIGDGRITYAKGGRQQQLAVLDGR